MTPEAQEFAVEIGVALLFSIAWFGLTLYFERSESDRVLPK